MLLNKKIIVKTFFYGNFFPIRTSESNNWVIAIFMSIAIDILLTSL